MDDKKQAEMELEFAENPEPRAPTMLVLDVSGSMSGAPIAQLNEGLKAFQSAIRGDQLTAMRVEVAIVAFDSNVRVLDTRSETLTTAADENDAFVLGAEFNAPTLVTGGQTALGTAVLKGLEILRARKAMYKANAVDYFRPFMFVMTDGAPLGEPDGTWQRAAAASKDEELRKGVTMFPIAVGDQADVEVLKQFSAKGLALKMAGLDFKELFVWLSKSVSSVAQSRLGDQVALPPVPGGIVIDTSV